MLADPLPFSCGRRHGSPHGGIQVAWNAIFTSSIVTSDPVFKTGRSLEKMGTDLFSHHSGDYGQRSRTGSAKSGSNGVAMRSEFVYVIEVA